MEAVIISHAADLDGLASAALLMRKYGISSKSVILADYSKESMEQSERIFNERFKDGGTLFITDLGADGQSLEIFARIVARAKSKGGKVFWFDHHPWSKESVDRLAKQCEVAVVGENEKFCAAEITAAQIGIDDPFVRELLRITHISDFALDPNNTKTKNIIGNYVLSMAYYSMGRPNVRLRMLEKMAECISKGIILPDFVREAAEIFTKLNDERLEKIDATVVRGGIVSVGFSKIVSTNDACMRIIHKTGSDIGCYVNVDSDKGHLRSVKSDCSRLAARFGGGGHPHAAGFEIDSKVYDMKTAQGRSKLAQDVIKVAAELYKNPES